MTVASAMEGLLLIVSASGSDSSTETTDAENPTTTEVSRTGSTLPLTTTASVGTGKKIMQKRVLVSQHPFLYDLPIMNGILVCKYKLN
jgi:hypothetical protein